MVRFSALSVGQVRIFLNCVPFNLLDIGVGFQVIPIVFGLKFPSVLLLCLVMVSASVALTHQGLQLLNLLTMKSVT